MLLALGMNEWREQRSHRREAEIALARVLGEVRSNHLILEKIHAHNTETLRLMSGPGVEEAYDRTIEEVPECGSQRGRLNRFRARRI